MALPDEHGRQGTAPADGTTNYQRKRQLRASPNPFLRTHWSSPYPQLQPPTDQTKPQTPLPRPPARTRKTPPPRPAPRARPPPPPPGFRTRSVSTPEGRVRKMIPSRSAAPADRRCLRLLHYPASVRHSQYPCGRSGGIFLSFRDLRVLRVRRQRARPTASSPISKASSSTCSTTGSPKRRSSTMRRPAAVRFLSR